MRKFLALFLLAPMLLSAKPQPSGELTITSTAPVTFTATTSNLPHGSVLWVSTSCFDDVGNRTYYGEEVARDGLYVMDDSVWFLWTPGAVAEGTCRALLIYRYDSPSGKGSTGEVILDDTGWFEAP